MTAPAATERTAALSAQLDRLNAIISAHIDRIQTSHRDKVIHVSTQLLDQLREAQLETLDMRAALFAENAQCSLALQDAATMIQLAANRPAGYCRAGAIHAMYGRQSAAVAMYERGLRAVSAAAAAGADGYTELMHGKADAQAQQAKRVDFIARLPYDLVSHVVSELLDEDELQLDHRYLLVSRTWRDRILQCAKLVFRLLHHCHDNVLKEIHQQLLAEAPNVGKVAVSFYWEEPDPLLNILRQGDFSALQELEITDYRIDNMQLLLSSLGRVANTLSRLTLQTDGELDVPILDLLDCCTHLDYLRYIGNCNAAPTLPATGRKHSLLHLVLHDVAGAKIDYGILQPILAQCPALYHLEVNGCSNAAILENTMRYCPRLAYLNVNFDPERDMLDRPSYARDQGLQVLEIGIICDAFYTRLGSFLASTQDTLYTLSVVINCELDAIKAPLPDRLQLNRLHELNCIYLVSTRDKYIVPWIMRQTCQLRSVLVVAADPVDRSAFDALAELDALERLEMRDCLNMDIAGLRRFFARHGTLGARSPMRELILRILGCDLESDEAIDLLGRMCTLTRLVISSVRGITMDGFERFAGRMRAWNRLSSLRFNNMDCISDHALEIIGHQLTALESLHLSFLNSITNGGVVQLAGSPSLHCLCVEHCANVDVDVAELVSHCLETKKRTRPF